MKNIFIKHWSYSLQENEGGEFIISVLCGTIGLYEKRMILSEIEKKHFEISGEGFLDELADDIRNSHKYEHRIIVV